LLEGAAKGGGKRENEKIGIVELSAIQIDERMAGKKIL